MLNHSKIIFNNDIVKKKFLHTNLTISLLNSVYNEITMRNVKFFLWMNQYFLHNNYLYGTQYRIVSSWCWFFNSIYSFYYQHSNRWKDRAKPRGHHDNLNLFVARDCFININKQWSTYTIQKLQLELNLLLNTQYLSQWNKSQWDKHLSPMWLWWLTNLFSFNNSSLYPLNFFSVYYNFFFSPNLTVSLCPFLIKMTWSVYLEYSL